MTTGRRLRDGGRILGSGLAALAVLASTVAVGAQPAPAAADDPTLYQPVDRDERGLWMQMDEFERRLRTDPAVIRDPALNAYVRGVLCRLSGAERCRSIRLYITRTPHFNASMAPNGVLQVWSGLLLRTRNEAQLAAVLGHEYTHFANRHSLRLWRDARAKSNAASWLALIPYAGLVSLGILSSVFEFSREMEREADDGGVQRMADAGYDTREAVAVWQQLRAEMDAAALVRKTKSRKDVDRGIFETHPPTAERVADLTAQARLHPGVPGETGADRFRAALAPFWPGFVDDQLKLNDFGGSEFLLDSLAAGGWTPPLLYAHAELYRRRAVDGDLDRARALYTQAIDGGGQMPELWRGRGLALDKLGRHAEARVDLAEYLRRAPDAPDKSMIAIVTGG